MYDPRCIDCQSYEAFPGKSYGRCDYWPEVNLQAGAPAKMEALTFAFSNCEKCPGFLITEEGMRNAEFESNQEFMNSDKNNGVKAGVDFPGSM